MLRRTRPLLVLAALCAAALAATGAVAHFVPIAEKSDSATLGGFVSLNRPRLTPVLDHIAHLADPAPYALIGLGLSLVALLRGRWRVALAIPVVLVATGATTENLKQLTASPRTQEWLGASHIADASWPSGHATAALTLGLCAVLASPSRWRPTVAAVGASFAIAVAYAILALGWHFPSDVLGGFLVAALWTLLAAAAVTAADVRWPPRAKSLERRDGTTGPIELAGPVGVAVLAASLAVGLAVTRPRAVVGYAQDHTTFVVGAFAIAALALVLAVGLVAGVRAGRTPSSG